MFKVKKTSRTRLFVKIVAASVLCLLLFAAWDLLLPHSYEPSAFVAPITAQDYTDVPLPPEARNIRVAEYRHWIQFEQYVRFEAPPEVCLKYAASILPGYTLQPVDEYELKTSRFPLTKGAFRDFTWFDLATAQNVVAAGGGSDKPSVWIDQTRGVFYGVANK